MKLIELKNMCTHLGITPIPTKTKVLPDGTRTKTESMSDCIKAIQEYYLNERKNNGTYEIKFSR